MAKTKRKAGKSGTTAGRGGLRARKSGESTALKPGLRKLKSSKPKPRKRKSSLPSETASLKQQLNAARMQREASADILRAVANAPGDAGRSLNEIAATTKRLFEASSVSIFVANGNEWGRIVHAGASSRRIGAEVSVSQLRIGGHSLPGAVFSENRQIHLPDIDNVDPAIADWPGLPPARAAGTRTICGTPLRLADEAIGVLTVHRDRLAPFTVDELALLQSFADQAAIAIENARLFNEVEAKTRDLSESLQQQTATADVLKVISRSAFDLQAVLTTLVRSALDLCNAPIGTFFLRDGNVLRLASQVGCTPELVQYFYDNPIPLNQSSGAGRAFSTGRVVHFPDVLADPDYRLSEVQRLGDYRSLLAVPLLREQETIGVFSLSRTRAEPFSQRQIDLVQTFADQAVIAIQNARLFNETQEALERQTATSEILRVISVSPTDVQPVFNALVLTARRLLRRELAFIIRCSETTFHPVAIAGPQGLVPIQNPTPVSINPSANFPSRAIVSKQSQQYPDWSAIDLPEEERKIREVYDVNSALYLPMLRGDECIGVLGLGGSQPGEFSEADIALAKSFCDQALIAIENARLFNETREALEQQKASADILSVISNSVADPQPVFDKILRSIEHLFGADERFVFLVGEDGLLHIGAVHGPNAERIRALFPVPLQGSASEVAIRERRLVTHANVFDDTDVPPILRETAHRFGKNYSMAVAPMLWEDRAIGSIFVGRTSMEPFGDGECSLLRTFADQAVIAIQNARLFDQVQSKSRDLEESLQQQTATADVLRIISRSVAHAAPVFETILESCQRLFNPYDAAVYLVEGDRVRGVARRGAGAGDWGADSMPLEGSSTGVAIAQRRPVHFPDLADKADLPEDKRAAVKEIGGMTVLYAPMISQDSGVGSLVVTRRPAKPFTEAEIGLIQTFADQAVIAIENARLFEEVQAKTADLTESLQQQIATADVLKVISRSAFDLQTVLETLARSAVDLSSARRGTVFLRDGDLFRFRAASHPDLNEDWIRFMVDNPQQAGRHSTIGRAIASGRSVCTPDVQTDPEIRMPTYLAGIRAVLAVPLLRDGKVEGVMALSRQEPGDFTARQIELVETFADQAVIAIENVRLFDEVQARTKELAASLDDLRTAQDRLVQTEKLASLGQLTAGIAHEIKNPLNFVNNFSALSAELIDEMTEVFENSALDEASRRKELDEIRELLKSNLEKVVQHGKRADSIVKNMLLHSREGSGEQRPADINALLDESLNLAYHGARAEKPDFNITLQRDLDPDAGAIDVFPQEITRALLNLISNGFYAASKRKAENGELDFEPVLSAATKNVGNHVEVRIRDNGTGMPPEVKEKIFNPFFTTKPAGEGTGLGLSMSHDIIVKQHGGSIEVETQPGQFTEFTIILPRAGVSLIKSRGRS
jgi:GAF domain-containing protein